MQISNITSLFFSLYSFYELVRKEEDNKKTMRYITSFDDGCMHTDNSLDPRKRAAVETTSPIII